MIKINDNFINLLKSFEGLSLKPYHGAKDKPGIFTIGYGTIKYPPYYMGGKKVELSDPVITEQQAFDFLKYEVEQNLPQIDLLIRDDLTENQFGALSSFCYNLGVGALKQSNLRVKVNNNPNDRSIKDEFLKWDMANHVHISGLHRRRVEEADLYFKTN